MLFFNSKAHDRLSYSLCPSSVCGISCHSIHDHFAFYLKISNPLLHFIIYLLIFEYTETVYATSQYPYVRRVENKGNNNTTAHSHARRKLAIKTSVSISTVCCCCCCFLEQSIRQTSLGFTISLLFVSKIRL